MTDAANTLVPAPVGVKDKVLPGHWFRLQDLSPEQSAQAASVFQGQGLENHLYLIHDTSGNLLDREHMNRFSFADLDSIGAL